jgi:hypothetical protein
MINRKTTKETVRGKLLRVLKRRKTPISTKELAMKAEVNYNSAKDELRRMYHDLFMHRTMQGRIINWRLVY